MQYVRRLKDQPFSAAHPPDRTAWRRALVDPVYFSTYFLGVLPHEGQCLWLRNSHKPENLLHCGNRWGKSLVQAVKFAHRLIFQIRNPRHDRSGRYVAVNVSITLDQARIVFNEVVRLLENLPWGRNLISGLVRTPFPMLRLSNGSVMWARSSQRRGEYLLGHDFDFVTFDEAAFESHPEFVIDEVLAMRVLDRAGRIDYISTPRGKNWFYRKSLQLLSQTEHGYVQRGDSRDNLYLPRDFLDRTVSRLSPQRVAQNIEGRFVDLGNEVLRDEDIQRALQMATGLSAPQANRRYVHGWDLARKRTWTVGVTLDVTALPMQIVAFERFQHRPWPAVYAAIRRRHSDYGGRVLIDATGLGDVVLAELQDIGAEGFNFGERGGRAKSELMAHLELQFAHGSVAVPHVEMSGEDGTYWSLAGELREFNWEDNTHCDAVFALALALWLIRRGGERTMAPAFRLHGW